MPDLFERHRELLDGALAAVRSRGYWSAFPETPSGKIYGETARADGEAAFKARLNAPFDLDHAPAAGRVGAEQSPYGFPLGVTYPRIDVDRTIEAALTAGAGWHDASIRSRAGVLLEALRRLGAQSFELAYAVMHTTGQSFVMAFQAGGPHAQDRALEAVAAAYSALDAIPHESVWEKPQGKGAPLRLVKRYRTIGRGAGLVVGCSTFPTWNAYPAIFADLMTGNPVIVKPHPNAILPLAITVQIVRAVLRETGFDPNAIQLAADTSAEPIAEALALRAEVKLIDYTGGNAFGDWLEANARQATVFTEKSGVNPVVVDSTNDLDGLIANLAFSLALYSGQMCTTPQNIFVARDGLETPAGRVTLGDFTSKLARAVEALGDPPEKAVELLGAIASAATLERLETAAHDGAVALASRAITHPNFPGAQVRTPLLISLSAADEWIYGLERFGPIAYIVATSGRPESLARAAALARTRGAITALVHSTDGAFLSEVRTAFAGAGVALSENLTGNVHVNQSAAFSDYHVSGGNPSGNASLTDANFISRRYFIAQSREPSA